MDNIKRNFIYSPSCRVLTNAPAFIPVPYFLGDTIVNARYARKLAERGALLTPSAKRALTTPLSPRKA